jgi:Sulfotransferase family
MRSLRDPIDHVCSLYGDQREEIEERGWSLADVYLELGGRGPRSSELHARFRGFFNGQTRRILDSLQAEPKLEYWAGVPERGAALRDEALEILAREDYVEAKGAERCSRPDPQTRSLILAHNQIDAELYAHFSGLVERDRPRRHPPVVETGAVCVLGMSRSGTSLTTRILNLLGVDLGSDDELMEPASGNNPAGFWEHKGIADLNEDILATLGDAPRQRWRWPPPLEEGWERDPRLERHRRDALAMLQQSFAGLPLWGWKDPRTCLTLPFWQQALGQVHHVESRLRYVVCVRHPLDVAGSLEARDGLGREEAMRLWLRYMSEAIVHTSGCPRTFVSYEGYFRDWQGQVARLAEFVGQAGPTEAKRATIVAQIDEELWHHREAVQTAQAELPPAISELYSLLTARCGPNPESTIEADLDATASWVAQSRAQA